MYASYQAGLPLDSNINIYETQHHMLFCGPFQSDKRDDKTYSKNFQLFIVLSSPLLYLRLSVII